MGFMDALKKTGHSAGSRTRKIPDSIWAPLTGSFLIFIVGLIGLIVGQPWLFPSLGPTAYLQVKSPGSTSARLYNTIMGHYVGIISGLSGLAVFNLWNTPNILISQSLTPEWVGAAVIAIFLTIFLNIILHSSHPPAAATALVVSLGAFRTPDQIFYLIMGVLIIGIAGEGIRRLRMS